MVLFPRPNIERLQILHDHLRDNVLPERFDLMTWFMAVGPRFEKLPSYLNVNDCGTTACAIGHASTIPQFNADGFDLNGQIPFYRDERGECSDGWTAVEEFFGVTREQAYELFLIAYSPDDTPDRNTIPATCKRIQSLIDAYK